MLEITRHMMGKMLVSWVKLKIYMIQMHRYAIGEIIRGWFYNKVFIEKIIFNKYFITIVSNKITYINIFYIKN
jgi:hypothetical protein